MAVIGLEYHKVMDRRKLFCKCKYLNEKTLTQNIHWVNLQGKSFPFRNTDLYCEYERQEGPPLLNQAVYRKCIRAIRQIPQIQLLPNIVFSRKKILDGSLVSGYQRSALVGHSGVITLQSGKKVRVMKIFLEEDSCSKIQGHYAVSRMGLPLVEVVTEAQELSPDEAVETLKTIDSFLDWSHNTPQTQYAKRQDINVSWVGRPRVEYKGVDKLSHIKRIVQLESTEIDEETVHTATYYYDQKLNKRILLRKTLKGQRMSYQSQIAPLSTKVSLLKPKTLGLEGPLAQQVHRIIPNSKRLNQLSRWIKIHQMVEKDFWYLIALEGVYGQRVWSVFPQYLSNQWTFEGLKKGLKIKPLGENQLKKIQQTLSRKEFFSQYKLYLPRNYED